MAGKVQGSKLSKDRQAALLALGDSVGDAKAAARFGIRSPTTVRNYRRALATDGELRALYEAAKERQDAVDDRVVEAEAAAIQAVWSAVRRSADMLGRDSNPASPQYLEALAKLIEAAGKNSDNRAELEMSRRLLERGERSPDGRRPEENPAHPAPSRGVPEAGAGAGAAAALQ